LLARFSLLATLLFHHNFADQVQILMFLKDFSIAGAFLILAARGSGRFGLDTRILA
jgi:putative oxidoreductase